jgi:hypothetical protein
MNLISAAVILLTRETVVEHTQAFDYAWKVRFHILTAANMKMIAFYGVVPCSLVEVDRSFIALLMKAVRSSQT